MEANQEHTYHLRKLLAKIQEERGLDFSTMRRAYLARRVGARLTNTGTPTIREYIRYLDVHPEEYVHLIDALTVNVSDFFRDRTVYGFLRRVVVPEILEGKKTKRHETVRVWSAGCSTGEEPYSIAVLFAEAMAARSQDRFQLAITGTDIDRAVLEYAKEGRYPRAKADTIPKDLRQKFLIPEDDHFRIAPEVMHYVRFRRLDLFADNAIGAADLILCRNVMIYFDRGRQLVVLRKFARSLRKGGFLVIGKSEKLAPEIGQELEARSVTERVYQRPS